MNITFLFLNTLLATDEQSQNSDEQGQSNSGFRSRALDLTHLASKKNIVPEKIEMASSSILPKFDKKKSPYRIYEDDAYTPFCKAREPTIDDKIETYSANTESKQDAASSVNFAAVKKHCPPVVKQKPSAYTCTARPRRPSYESAMPSTSTDYENPFKAVKTWQPVRQEIRNPQQPVPLPRNQAVTSTVSEPARRPCQSKKEGILPCKMMGSSTTYYTVVQAQVPDHRPFSTLLTTQSSHIQAEKDKAKFKIKQEVEMKMQQEKIRKGLEEIEEILQSDAFSPDFDFSVQYAARSEIQALPEGKVESIKDKFEERSYKDYIERLKKEHYEEKHKNKLTSKWSDRIPRNEKSEKESTSKKHVMFTDF